MKRIRIILLFVFIFLITGCTGKYDVKINDDLSVDESLYLEIKNADYEKTLNIFEENGIKKDNYSVSRSSNSVIIKYNESFESLDDYILDSKVYHQLIDDIQYTKNDKYIDLYVDEKLKLKNSSDSTLIGNVNDLESLDINVELPFKVLTSNADSINDNTYTWNINKDSLNQKMFIQFNQNRSNNLSMQLIVFVVIIICSIILGVYITKTYKEKHKI
jgi:hypothetical protein